MSKFESEGDRYFSFLVIGGLFFSLVGLCAGLFASLIRSPDRYVWPSMGTWAILFVVTWEVIYLISIYLSKKGHWGDMNADEYGLFEFVQMKLLAIPGAFLALGILTLIYSILAWASESVFNYPLTYLAAIGAVFAIVGYFILNAWIGKMLAGKKEIGRKRR